MSEPSDRESGAGVVVLDGRAHARAELSDKSRGLVESLRMADQEIARAPAFAAMPNVARQSYAAALRAEPDACGAVGHEPR